MKIGIDLRLCSFGRSGFYRFAQGLIRSIRDFGSNHQWVVFSSGEEFNTLQSDSIHILKSKAPLFSHNEGEMLNSEAIEQGLDCLHFPFSLYPRNFNQNALLTIHDLSCLQHPDSVSEEYRSFYSESLGRSRQADRIAVCSIEIKKDLVDQLGLAPDLVIIAPPRTPFDDPEYFDAGMGLGEGEAAILLSLQNHPFILSVGSLDPRKNYLASLKIMERLWDETTLADRWVIVGWDDRSDSQFEAALGNSRYRHRVLLLKRSTDALLQRLYQECLLFLNYSLYEGFSFPALEALYFGAALLSSRVPALSQTGISQDVFLDPDEDQRSFARIVSLLKNADKRQLLREESHQIVSRYYAALDRARLLGLYEGLIDQRRITRG